MKKVKTLTNSTLKSSMKKVDAASARLPVSLHARLPAPLATRAARTQTDNYNNSFCKTGIVTR